MPKFPVDCPDCKIVPFGDHCYFLNFLDDNRKIAPKRNWIEAQKYCRDLSTDDWNYDLINVGSDEEYKFMIDGPDGKNFEEYGNKGALLVKISLFIAFLSLVFIIFWP